MPIDPRFYEQKVDAIESPDAVEPDPGAILEYVERFWRWVSTGNRRIWVALGVVGRIFNQDGTGETVGFTAGAGTGVNDDSTFTGNVGSTAYRISDIIKALKNGGILVE